MKKIVSVIVAVLMMSEAFAQTQSRVASYADYRASQTTASVSKVYQKTHPMGNAQNLRMAAPDAEEATDTLEVVLVNPNFIDATASNGWILLQGRTADNQYFVSFSNWDERTTMYGEYDYASIDTNDTYVKVGEAGTIGGSQVRVSIVDGHAKVSNEPGDYFFEAYLLGEDNHCYHVTYAPETIEVVLNDPSFVDYSAAVGGYNFFGYTEDSSYAATLFYFSNTVTGTFTKDYFDMGYTRVYSGSTAIQMTDVNATVTEFQGGYDLDAYFLSTGLRCYHVTAHYVIPVASDTIDVNVPVSVLEVDLGGQNALDAQVWTGVSDDSEYEVFISYVSAVVAGTYSYEYLLENSNINGVDFRDGHLTVLSTGEDSYKLEAYLLGRDLHCYHVNMTYVRPTLEESIDTIMVVIPVTEMVDLTASSDPGFQMIGMSIDQSYTVAVTLNSTQILGSYTYASFNRDYTFIRDNVNHIDHISVVDGHVDVTEQEHEYAMDAYLLGSDLHCYHAVMTFSVPYGEDTVEVTVADATLYDYRSQSGPVQFYGVDNSQNITASLGYISTSIEGTYTLFDCNNSEYTYLVVGSDRVRLYSLNATVTATATGYAVDAYYVGYNNVCYHVTMTCTAVGINSVDKVAVSVYPNPATDVLHIEADGISRVEMIDVAGRVVFSQTQDVNTLNIGSLANGIYMLRTTTNEGVSVQRIVKK